MKKWLFPKSWTIFWARFQTVLGTALMVVASVDMTPLISNPKYLPVWLVISGTITELCRRRSL